MFRKRKIELEIKRIDKQNFNVLVAIKGAFSIENLKNKFYKQYPLKTSYKNLKQKVMK